MCNFKALPSYKHLKGEAHPLREKRERKYQLNDNEACKERPLPFPHNGTDSFFDVSLEHPLAVIGIIGLSGEEYTLWIR